MHACIYIYYVRFCNRSRGRLLLTHWSFFRFRRRRFYSRASIVVVGSSPEGRTDGRTSATCGDPCNRWAESCLRPWRGVDVHTHTHTQYYNHNVFIILWMYTCADENAFYGQIDFRSYKCPKCRRVNVLRENILRGPVKISPSFGSKKSKKKIKNHQYSSKFIMLL